MRQERSLRLRRDPREELQHRAEPGPPADGRVLLPHEGPEAVGVDPAEEVDRRGVEGADLRSRRRRRSERRVVEPRAVVREVGGEDEEGLPVVEHRQPQGEGLLGGGVDPPDEDRDEGETPEYGLQERQLDLDGVLRPGHPGNDPREPRGFQHLDGLPGDRDLSERRPVGRRVVEGVAVEGAVVRRGHDDDSPERPGCEQTVCGRGDDSRVGPPGVRNDQGDRPARRHRGRGRLAQEVSRRGEEDRRRIGIPASCERRRPDRPSAAAAPRAPPGRPVTARPPSRSASAQGRSRRITLSSFRPLVRGPPAILGPTGPLGSQGASSPTPSFAAFSRNAATSFA